MSDSMTTPYTAETCPTKDELFQQFSDANALTKIQRFNTTLNEVLKMISDVKEIDKDNQLKTLEFEYDFADLSYYEVAKFLETKGYTALCTVPIYDPPPKPHYAVIIEPHLYNKTDPNPYIEQRMLTRIKDVIPQRQRFVADYKNAKLLINMF